MTMPHLGNCPHKPGTWCLACVREEWERRERERDAMETSIRSIRARAERLARLVRADDEVTHLTCLSTSRDEYDAACMERSAARRCVDYHNDLSFNKEPTDA